MVTDQQVRKLMKLIDTEPTLSMAAAKVGMSENTARRYRTGGRLPSERAAPHTWRTREDPFEAVWPALEPLLEVNPGLQARTLFDHLQRTEPGRFADGQLRTLQRKVQRWRVECGPSRDVMFPQVHEPGALGASDFFHLDGLGVTLGGTPFPHLLYHFVLTYSNWETAMICFSESFESLSEGLQRAFWTLGGVPRRHRTDRLGAAVAIDRKAREGEGHPGEEPFHRRYQGLLDHYGVEGQRIQARQPHENGDCEQRHHRTRTAIDQALMLRGHRDFGRRSEYEQFLFELLGQLNAGRRERLAEEKAQLLPLPARPLEAFTRREVRVGPSSTIRVADNTYSLPSRLIGEPVSVRVHADRIEVHHGPTGRPASIREMPRLVGRGKVRIDYRDVIDSLVKKPGAFAGYRYRDELFPSSRFRRAYDRLVAVRPLSADREYLRLLHLAAHGSERAVEEAIEVLLGGEESAKGFGWEAVRDRVQAQETGRASVGPPPVAIDGVDLGAYDALIGGE
jgi:hypothetical protein